MTTRKVQLTGGSTYTVSLPKRWADEHRIEAGRELTLTPSGDGSLVVRATPDDDADAISTAVAVDGYDAGDLRRTVRALYAVGLDEFTLTGVPSAHRRAVTDAARNLSGLEVTVETDRRVTFRNLLNRAEDSIRQSVLQLEYVTTWMHRNAVTALADGDEERAARVVERDDEADRLFWSVHRHFQRALADMTEVERLGLDRPTVFAYYTTARQFERVADHAEKVARLARRLDAPPTDATDELVTLAHRSREVVIDAASVLLDGGSVEQAYTAFDERDAVLDTADALDQALYERSTPDAYLLGLALDSVRRTAEYGGNVAAAMVEASVRPDSGVEPPGE